MVEFNLRLSNFNLKYYLFDYKKYLRIPTIIKIDSVAEFQKHLLIIVSISMTAQQI